MAVYTAGDQINRALRLIGVLAEGETDVCICYARQFDGT